MAIHTSFRCELLTKFIIFAIGNNFESMPLIVTAVVNCLQNLLSLRSETTQRMLSTILKMLWIAYKIYYLCDRKQLLLNYGNQQFSCELLTKFIIFAIGNNLCHLEEEVVLVVNCLQNLLSLRSETTQVHQNLNPFELWIAYKIYYLCDRKQRNRNWYLLLRSCELLTKFIIFAIGNNEEIAALTARELWIAYKIYYLCDRKQLPDYYVADYYCCELLTKFIIFAIGNNQDISEDDCWLVVNCLQNLLSLRSETTGITTTANFAQLWIAYKIYYLCDRKQRKV